MSNLKPGDTLLNCDCEQCQLKNRIAELEAAYIELRDSKACNCTSSECHKCGSLSGVYLQICDDCMARFNQLDGAG